MRFGQLVGLAAGLLLSVATSQGAIAIEDPNQSSLVLHTVEHGFDLRYPNVDEVTAQHPLDPSYEETFYFRPRLSTPPPGEELPPGIYLRVVDLKKYLPNTATKTERSYLKAMRQLRGFRPVQIGSKAGYEFLSCGCASCEMAFMFIHKHHMYTVVVHVESDDPQNYGFPDLTPEQQQILLSLRFLD